MEGFQGFFETACKPGSVPPRRGELFIWDVCHHTPHATDPDDDLEADRVSSLFGFAPGGVYPAIFVTKDAVRSYRTLSPLPPRRRFTFCGTFPQVTLAGRYPAPCLYGARTFLKGLLLCNSPAVSVVDIGEVRGECKGSLGDFFKKAVYLFSVPQAMLLQLPLGFLKQT